MRGAAMVEFALAWPVALLLVLGVGVNYSIFLMEGRTRAGTTGVAGALADPTLELRGANGALIVANDNWKIRSSDGTSQQAEIEATGVAPTNDAESALVATLQPGNYTAQLRGSGESLLADIDLLQLGYRQSRLIFRVRP